MSKLDAKYALAVWLLATLVGIALVGTAPLLGVGIAAAGGVVCGVICWLGWNARRARHE